MTNFEEKQIAEKIRASYLSSNKELSKLDELKALDKKVKKPALIFAYVYGIIGSLILGLGMCLAMKVIGNLMILGVIIGIVGILMVSTCYTLYQKILTKRKEKYKDEILDKSNELLNKGE